MSTGPQMSGHLSTVPGTTGHQMSEFIWRDQFDKREKGQLDHAVTYAEFFKDAGVPGHGQFILIAKLIKLLEEEIARNTIVAT
jgi:hypothetical protein